MSKVNSQRIEHGAIPGRGLGLILSREQIRSVDQQAIEVYGMSGLVLMENAGRGAAELLDALVPHGNVTILAGLGNNGGDGFVIARHLENLRGSKPRVFMVGPQDVDVQSKMSHDAFVNFSILIRSGFDVQRFDPSNLEHARSLTQSPTVVDAMLGTGAQGELREPYRSIVARANSTQGVRVAIDIPTGLDCDSGLTHGPCFRADHTLTFVAAKLGFGLREGPEHVGTVRVLPIGVPKVLLDRFDVRI